jgi:hypothetical protein
MFLSGSNPLALCFDDARDPRVGRLSESLAESGEATSVSAEAHHPSGMKLPVSPAARRAGS